MNTNIFGHRSSLMLTIPVGTTAFMTVPCFTEGIQSLTVLTSVRGKAPLKWVKFSFELF